MTSPARRPATSSGRAPSLRLQLHTVLTLYQLTTTLYFLLVEQRASTSTASTRANIAAQIKKLRDALQAQQQQFISTAGRSAGRRRAVSAVEEGASADLFPSLRPVHAERLGDLAVFQELLELPQTAQRTGSLDVPSSSGSGSGPFTISQTGEALKVLDVVLADLMHRARQHAQNQARIRRLMGEIGRRDEAMVQSIRRLAVLQDRCKRLVKLGSEEEEAIKRAEKQPLSYEEILSYGRMLSQTTTAPPGFKLRLEEEQEGDVEEGADVKASKPPLYRADAEDAEARSGQIPPHLQDKLPFPSVDAMRRGASEIQTPTWAQFQRGILHAGPPPDDEAGKSFEQQSGDTRMEEEGVGFMRGKTAAHRPPVEEADEGFGLDLN